MWILWISPIRWRTQVKINEENKQKVHSWQIFYLVVVVGNEHIKSSQLAVLSCYHNLLLKFRGYTRDRGQSWSYVVRDKEEKVKYGPSESFISSQNYLFLIVEAIPWAFECHLFIGKEQYSLYEYEGLLIKSWLNRSGIKISPRKNTPREDILWFISRRIIIT